MRFVSQRNIMVGIILFFHLISSINKLKGLSSWQTHSSFIKKPWTSEEPLCHKMLFLMKKGSWDYEKSKTDSSLKNLRLNASLQNQKKFFYGTAVKNPTSTLIFKSVPQDSEACRLNVVHILVLILEQTIVMFVWANPSELLMNSLWREWVGGVWSSVSEVSPAASEQISSLVEQDTQNEWSSCKTTQQNARGISGQIYTWH